MPTLAPLVASGDGLPSAEPCLGPAGWAPAARTAGGHDPFRRFVEAHQRALYALAHRLTGDHAAADDLVQETFVKAWSALQGGTVPDVPEAWLRTIAVRLFLNARRASLARRFVRWTDDLLHRLPDPSSPPEPTFEAAFSRALGCLTERERAAFVLRHVEDRSTRDTAETLGIAEGTVKALLARAVAKMKPLLQPYA